MRKTATRHRVMEAQAVLVLMKMETIRWDNSSKRFERCASLKHRVRIFHFTDTGLPFVALGIFCNIGLIVSSASSGSSGISGVEADAKRLIPDGNFLTPSLWIRSSQTSNCHTMVAEWLENIGYNK